MFNTVPLACSTNDATGLLPLQLRELFFQPQYWFPGDRSGHFKSPFGRKNSFLLGVWPTVFPDHSALGIPEPLPTAGAAAMQLFSCGTTCHAILWELPKIHHHETSPASASGNDTRGHFGGKPNQSNLQLNSTNTEKWAPWLFLITSFYSATWCQAEQFHGNFKMCYFQTRKRNK